MIRGCTYEVWRKGKQIGSYFVIHPLVGRYHFINHYSVLKQPYGEPDRYFKLEISTRIIDDDGVDYRGRRILVADGIKKRRDLYRLKLLIQSGSEEK